MNQLETGQPQLPERLEMVAGRGDAWQTRQPFREEIVLRVPQRRPGRDNARAEVDGDYEDCKARAAEMSSSKSGTSASS